MKREAKFLLIGLVAAAQVPLLAMALLSQVIGEPDDAGNSRFWHELLEAAVFTYTGFLVVSAVLVVPVFMILRRLNLVRGWTSLLSGILIGFAVIYTYERDSPWLMGIYGGIGGACCATVFWFIYRMGLPSEPGGIGEKGAE